MTSELNHMDTIPPADDLDLESVQLFADLLSTASTPGQVAAVVTVLRLNAQSQAEAARQLGICKQRMSQLCKLIRSRIV